MKLNCSVSVGIRHPSLAINSRRHVSSTLALCKNPKLKGYSIILFSAENKTGTKYQVSNISKILTRFLHEGKATIQFHVPQHDLYIRAETILLKGFLHVLKQAMENKTEKELMCSSISVTAGPLKPVVKKLKIENLSNYPVKGFPRTLEALHINNIGRCSVDKRILQLVKLQVLDLSNNCLESLPIELSNLPCLTELNISHNQLGKGALKQWEWMGGKFSTTLKILDLRNNDLKYLPNRLIKLERLVTLRVDSNGLKRLPPAIGTLRYLRNLTASNNLISLLPGSVRKLRLQVLDLSANHWTLECIHDVTNTNIVNSLKTFSLKELASRRVLNLKLSFTCETLPQTLIEDLETAEYCNCGSACLSAFIKQLQLLPLHTISDSVSASPASGLFIPINAYYCSIRCFDFAPCNRRRNRIVR